MEPVSPGIAAAAVIPVPRVEYDGYASIHRCTCGKVIGDGDWASGKRACVFCRPRRPRRR